VVGKRVVARLDPHETDTQALVDQLDGAGRITADDAERDDARLDTLLGHDDAREGETLATEVGLGVVSDAAQRREDYVRAANVRIQRGKVGGGHIVGALDDDAIDPEDDLVEVFHDRRIRVPAGNGGVQGEMMRGC